jgi:PTH1 family peptidyl-tRNA hydrolase
MWRSRAAQSPSDSIVVVGLGNPGPQYVGTRHNIGQDVVETFAADAAVSWQDTRKLKAQIATVKRDGRLWVLVIPTTFMNRSGEAVQAAAAFYKTSVDNIIVCHDDLDVELGQLRVKRGGSPAGHNGLKDIDRALGTSEYLRVRIGIGRPPGRMDASKFVLARFSAAERPVADSAVRGACEAIVSLSQDGVDATQNRFHGRVL